MPVRSYNLHLKGTVGKKDFCADQVHAMLQARADKPVSVLIDSTGGSLAQGLSIAGAFRDHGDVTVHFTGLNASAATIASLGAKRITIDRGAAYLIHQCSAPVMLADSFNADQLAALIAEVQQRADDLAQLDRCVAAVYASRCRKDARQLLDLMKVGGWLTPQEALEWGFVDEVTDYAEDPKAKVTDTLAMALAQADIPIPALHEDGDDAQNEPQTKKSTLADIIAAAARFLGIGSQKQDSHTQDSNTTTTNTIEMKYTALCAALGIAAVALTDGQAQLSDEQLAAADKALTDLQAKLTEAEAEKTDLQAKLAQAEAKAERLLKEKPAASTTTVIESSKPEGSDHKSDAQRFVDAYNRAGKLLDLV